MNLPARTLVTGSSGLLGQAIRQIVTSSEFYFTKREESDLLDFEQTIALFNRIKPETVLHLAAVVGGVEANSLAPAEFFTSNMQINLNVYRAASAVGSKRIISFASTCVFPDSAEYPLKVQDLHLGEPHHSNFGYAYSKRMLDVLGRTFQKQYAIDSRLLIPANIYGPGEDWNSEKSHVIPALIRRIHQASLTNGKLEVWGSGSALREFVFSKDVARASLLILRKSICDSPLIISSGVEISIRSLVEILVDEMKFRGEVYWNTSKPEGQLRKPSEHRPFYDCFPDFEFTDLAIGLRETIDSFYASLES